LRLVKFQFLIRQYLIVIVGHAFRPLDDLRPLPIEHRVGRGHGLDHEGRRQVRHESQHDQDGGTQAPPSKIVYKSWLNTEGVHGR